MPHRKKKKKSLLSPDSKYPVADVGAVLATHDVISCIHSISSK